MKRCLVAMLSVLILLGQWAPGSGATSPAGRVIGLDSSFFGAFVVQFSERVSLLPRDVLEVRRGGTLHGEAMVICSSAVRAIVLPRMTDLRPGDELIFVRHAVPMPRLASLPPSVQAAAPVQSAEPVVMLGRDTSISGGMSTGYAGSYFGAAYTESYGSGGYGSYGYGYGYGYGARQSANRGSSHEHGPSSCVSRSSSNPILPGAVNRNVWGSGMPSVWR